jgi:GTPase SAR1 family protein
MTICFIGGEYHLHESALYFFDRVSILRSPNYKVNDQDMLRTRVQTNGIIETKFCTHGINFHIFDVGGQRDQRKKWIQCFDDVTAIIFVADISSFHKTIVEDNSTNRLVEALTVFNQIWNNRYLYHVSIILFLNKYDIFSHMILNEHCKLEDHFPAFKEYKCPENINNTFIVPNERSEVTRAKMFILEEFINITRNIDKSKMLSATRSVEMKNSLEYSQNNESLETYNKFCMPYFTCAVDTENIRRVFKSCRSILRKENMIKSGLI